MTDEEVLRRSIEESRHGVDPLLATCLRFAVPLWIEQVRNWSHREREDKAHAASELICYGNGAAYVATAGKERGKGKAGEVSQMFNAIAVGLAVLAYGPGGITFAGQHWEAE